MGINPICTFLPQNSVCQSVGKRKQRKDLQNEEMTFAELKN